MPSIFKLKTLLTESSRLSDVLDYFLKLTETSNIIPRSKVLDEEEINQNEVLKILIQVIEKMVGDFLKQKINLINPMICSVENKCFYHGIFVLSKLEIPISMFYFSDIKRGFFAISGFNKKTEMFRFSLTHLDKMPVMHNGQVVH